jgi:hypothetical protein
LTDEKPVSVLTGRFRSRRCKTKSNIRLARYYKRSLADGASRYISISDYFVRNAVAPQNAMSPGRIYLEQVVPCGALRDSVKAAFEVGGLVRYVAEWIESMMMVVWIKKAEAGTLTAT